MDKIKLKVLAVSYSQTQNGAYALILSEENEKRRIPIIIGGSEAQAIAIEHEGLKPPRPLTHDLFVSFAEAFNIEVVEVIINKFEEGVFYSEISCINGQKRIKIDARTSDSVALALRFKCPIYATSEVVNKAGIQLENQSEEDSLSFKEENIKTEHEIKTIMELEKRLIAAIEEEKYELASEIRDEIKKRKNKL